MNMENTEQKQNLPLYVSYNMNNYNEMLDAINEHTPIMYEGTSRIVLSDYVEAHGVINKIKCATDDNVKPRIFKTIYAFDDGFIVITYYDHDKDIVVIPVDWDISDSIDTLGWVTLDNSEEYEDINWIEYIEDSKQYNDYDDESLTEADE